MTFAVALIWMDDDAHRAIDEHGGPDVVEWPRVPRSGELVRIADRSLVVHQVMTDQPSHGRPFRWLVYLKKYRADTWV